MPIYIVQTTATTEIRETWAVEAESLDEAQEKVFGGECAFLSEENIGEERDREHYGTELAGAREAMAREALIAGGYIED